MYRQYNPNVLGFLLAARALEDGTRINLGVAIAVRDQFIGLDAEGFGDFCDGKHGFFGGFSDLPVFEFGGIKFHKGLSVRGGYLNSREEWTHGFPNGSRGDVLRGGAVNATNALGIGRSKGAESFC